MTKAYIRTEVDHNGITTETVVTDTDYTQTVSFEHPQNGKTVLSAYRTTMAEVGWNNLSEFIKNRGKGFVPCKAV